MCNILLDAHLQVKLADFGISVTNLYTESQNYVDDSDTISFYSRLFSSTSEAKAIDIKFFSLILVKLLHFGKEFRMVGRLYGLDLMQAINSNPLNELSEGYKLLIQFTLNFSDQNKFCTFTSIADIIHLLEYHLMHEIENTNYSSDGTIANPNSQTNYFRTKLPLQHAFDLLSKSPHFISKRLNCIKNIVRLGRLLLCPRTPPLSALKRTLIQLVLREIAITIDPQINEAKMMKMFLFSSFRPSFSQNYQRIKLLDSLFSSQPITSD